MADDIIREAPPHDAVLVWVSRTIEHDYVQRNVFTELRHENGRRFSAGSVLYITTPKVAEAVLADASARKKNVGSGLLTAYGSFVTSVERAISDAKTRQAEFAADRAVMVCTTYRGELWRGTKAQLQAHGVELAGPWPTEPGGKTRRAAGRDRLGRRAWIRRHSPLWPGLFEVDIELPKRATLPNGAGSQNAQKLAERLRDMPSSGQAYRNDCAPRFYRLFRVTHRFMTDYDGGYRFDQESCNRVKELVEEIGGILANADIEFSAAKRSESIARLRQELFGEDAGFDRFMARLA